MFWKKKKVNDVSAFGIVSLISPFSYDIHDALMKDDENSKCFIDKGEILFIHTMAASAMLAIINLDDDYFTLYYDEIVGSLEKNYSNIRQTCEDFISYVTNHHDEDTRFTVMVLQWFHLRVGTGDPSNQTEINLLADIVKAIFSNFYDFFNKYRMSIK